MLPPPSPTTTHGSDKFGSPTAGEPAIGPAAAKLATSAPSMSVNNTVTFPDGSSQSMNHDHAQREILRLLVPSTREPGSPSAPASLRSTATRYGFRGFKPLRAVAKHDREAP